MQNRNDYEQFLESQAELPRGFRLAVTSISFSPAERPVEQPYDMNLALLVADRPEDLDESTAAFASGKTTRNRFSGAPVLLARERLPGVQALIVNNRISNVAAPGGLEDARAVCRAVSEATGIPEERVLSSSTGIIGWRIPRAEMVEAVPFLSNSLHSGSALPFARSIMTTDAFPKLAGRDVAGGRIVGVAKGAGMIEPNLATMLVFFITDLRIGQDLLDGALSEAIESSFNTISVDSDQSTSDTVLILSSGQVEPEGADWHGQFRRTLTEMARELAHQIVRNGEGTRHVIRCTVDGLPSQKLAMETAKAIVNSPLVKTAIFGNDPNVGRIIMAVGDYLGSDAAEYLGGNDIDVERMVLSVAGHPVFSKGSFLLSPEMELQLSGMMRRAAIEPAEDGSSPEYPTHSETVDIHVQFSDGTKGAEVLGSDLSCEYVRENADYRT